MTELELIKQAKLGDEKALDWLYTKYKIKVMQVAKKYYINDGAIEDLVQEGMMGFVKAINTFDAEKGEFAPYLKLLVEQQILNAIKKSNALKNNILNNRLNLNNQGEIEGEGGKTIGIPSETMSPELSIINDEDRKSFDDIINNALSPFEKQVLQLYLAGKKYGDIIKELNVTYKSVDNALNRIKTKLQKISKGD